MATYLELFDFFSNSTLRNRIAVASLIAAETIRTESGATVNHINRLIWAKGAFASPGQEAERLLKAILAANSGLTVAQINAVTDAQLQTAVNNAIDVFATGS